MNPTENPYSILGVSQDADEETIRKAYRKAAKLNHPDKQTNEEDRKLATERFAKIADAYALLNDPVKRYDWRQANESSFRSSSSRRSPNPKTSSANKSAVPSPRQVHRSASFGPGQSQRSSDASVCSTSTRSTGSTQSNSSNGRRKSRVSVGRFTNSSPQPSSGRKTPTKSGSNAARAQTSLNEHTITSSSKPKRPSHSPSCNTVHKRPLKNAGSNNPIPRRIASLGGRTTKPTVLGSQPKPTRPSQPSNLNSPPSRRFVNSGRSPNPIQRADSLGSKNTKIKPTTRVSLKQKQPSQTSNTIPRRSMNSTTKSHVPCEKGRKKNRVSLNGSGAVPIQGRRVPPAA